MTSKPEKQKGSGKRPSGDEQTPSPGDDAKGKRPLRLVLGRPEKWDKESLEEFAREMIRQLKQTDSQEP